MTHQEIIAMAREIGLSRITTNVFALTSANLERFAALVAANEREACAQVALAQGRSWEPHALDPQARIAAAIRARGAK